MGTRSQETYCHKAVGNVVEISEYIPILSDLRLDIRLDLHRMVVSQETLRRAKHADRYSLCWRALGQAEDLKKLLIFNDLVLTNDKDGVAHNDVVGLLKEKHLKPRFRQSFAILMKKVVDLLDTSTTAQNQSSLLLSLSLLLRLKQ